MCANCEWSISPELEEDIMDEQGYEYNDPNRPIARDCVLGNIHDEKYYCPSHLYCDGTEETYILYDDNDLGPGLLIVNTLNDEIEKFIKISADGEG